MTVERARPCMIVDTEAHVSRALAAEVLAHGYAGVVRYVPHSGGSGAGDIAAAELAAILGAGLALLLVQHVRKPPWDPGGCSAVADAQSACRVASAAGYGAGAHLFLDLEGISGTGAATKKFAEQWAAIVNTSGYRAGAYVGYSVPLTPLELYDLHGITSYWSDAGPRAVATRGFAMKQHAAIEIGGVLFDSDTIQADEIGETPFWVRGDAPSV